MRSLTTGIESQALKEYAKDKKCLVEVGVCWGGTSKLLRAVMAPDAFLHLIDPFLPSVVPGQGITADYEQAKKNVESVQRGTVVWYVETSLEAAAKFTGQADFVFIDGLHDKDSILLDWSLWSPKVAPGGVVLFHDVTPRCPDAVEAWNIASKTPGWEVLPSRDTIAIMRKL